MADHGRMLYVVFLILLNIMEAKDMKDLIATGGLSSLQYSDLQCELFYVAADPTLQSCHLNKMI